MICLIFSGVLTCTIANALALQTSANVMRNCDKAGCDVEALSPNQSNPAVGDFVCQCCWRDCDLQSEGLLFMAHGGHSMVKDTQVLSEIDAWLVMHHALQPFDWNMYTPILETVKTALEDQGAAVRVIPPVDVHKMIKAVKHAVAQGRRPLVFTVAHEFASHPESTYAKMKDAKEAGAYLVAYNAEPFSNLFDTDGTLHGLRSVLDMAARMSADEIWEYSRGQVEHYLQQPHTPIIRYVPPGYVRRLDVGVDLDSTFVREGVLGYMGGDKALSDKYKELFPGEYAQSYKIWSTGSLRRFLERYPLQLNHHRIQTCCPREGWEDTFQQFESFRMASLLANKACVISAPTAIKDMQIWQGLVTFAEVEDTKSTKERLQRNLRECRVNTYETYKREFAPSKLLTQSKFFTAWRPPHGV